MKGVERNEMGRQKKMKWGITHLMKDFAPLISSKF